MGYRGFDGGTNQLHAREFSRQKVEAMIGSGILNKMTSLGMPQSYRCA